MPDSFDAVEGDELLAFVVLPDLPRVPIHRFGDRRLRTCCG